MACERNIQARRPAFLSERRLRYNPILQVNEQKHNILKLLNYEANIKLV